MVAEWSGSLLEWETELERVPSREWLKFESGVISSL